jgi:osmotically inducible protein OsmC
MAAKRRASVVWQGSLLEGNGVIETTGSGVIGDLPVTWASRTEEREQGRTSPEELLAAAHASCFSMAFSHGLAQAGHAPERLEVSAETTFVPGQGITHVDLHVRGRVPGVDDAAFLAAASDAKANCPVSQALRGNVDISLDAALE